MNAGPESTTRARASGGRQHHKPRTQAQKRANTQRIILEAALRVLTERGYAGASFSLITGEANVSRGGINHHFPSKADLVASAMQFFYAETHREKTAALLSAVFLGLGLMGSLKSEEESASNFENFIHLLESSIEKPRSKPLERKSAVVYCGSMGDWPLLTDEQRRRGVEASVTSGVPVMVLEGNPEYGHQFHSSDALTASQRGFREMEWQRFRNWWDRWPGAESQ